jgi:hypothetical protein
MPKENIHDDLGTFDVTVGWQPGHEMQVGITVANGAPIIRHLYMADAERIGREVGAIPASVTDPKELGRAIVEVIATAASNPDGPYSGLYATLDRAASNRLVRAVRKARDAAYGRDE